MKSTMLLRTALLFLASLVAASLLGAAEDLDAIRARMERRLPALNAELRSGDTGSGSTIVRAIQLMAQSLGLEVIAEGIETQEQCLQLQQLGLSLGQGYLFAKPASAADVLARYGLAEGG